MKTSTFFGNDLQETLMLNFKLCQFHLNACARECVCVCGYEFIWVTHKLKVFWIAPSIKRYDVWVDTKLHH